MEDAVLPWSVREISDDDLYRGKVRMCAIHPSIHPEVVVACSSG